MSILIDAPLPEWSSTSLRLVREAADAELKRFFDSGKTDRDALQRADELNDLATRILEAGKEKNP